MNQIIIHHVPSYDRVIGLEIYSDKIVRMSFMQGSFNESTIEMLISNINNDALGSNL